MDIANPTRMTQSRAWSFVSIRGNGAEYHGEVRICRFFVEY
jgi:hypothetical protein